MLLRLVLFVLTLVLGAVLYSLVRADQRAGGGPQRPLAASRQRCEAVTTSGTRCSREAGSGSRFCWQHAG